MDEKDNNNTEMASCLDSLFKGYDYVGWIPNLVGQLYFKYLECRSGIGDRLTINFSKLAENSESQFYRSIFVTSIDNATDWYKDEDHTGLVRYVLKGRTSPENPRKKSLKGEIYLFFVKGKKEEKPSEPVYDLKNNSDDEEKKLSKLVYKVKNSSNEAYSKHRHGGLTTKQLQEELAGYYDSLEKQTELIISSGKFFVVALNFEIIKEGFIGLSLIPTPYDLDKNSLMPDTFGRLPPRVVELAYYYIKFSLHKNYHHHSRHDAATGLAISSLLRSEDGSIKKEEAKNIFIGDIRRAIIDARRGSLKNNIDVSGFATYGKSLILSLGKLGFYKNDSESKTDIESLGFFQESTEAYSKRLGIDGRAKNYFSFLSVFSKVTITVFALIAPILHVWLRTTPDPTYIESKFYTVLLGYLSVVFIAFAISYSYVKMTLKPVNSESTVWNVIKDYFYNFPSKFKLAFFEETEYQKIIQKWNEEEEEEEGMKLPRSVFVANVIVLIWEGNNNFSSKHKVFLILKTLLLNWWEKLKK